MDKFDNMPYFSINLCNHRFKSSFDISNGKEEPRNTIIVGKVQQVGSNIFEQNISIL